MFALALVFVLAVAGCATPVGVTRITPEKANRARVASALTTGKPSAFSQQFLYRLDLAKLYEDDPAAALAALHSELGKADDSDRLFALAELSYIYATQSEDRSYYLAAAAYAWAFLFPHDSRPRTGSYDARILLALGIYDRAIAEGLSAGEGDAEYVDLAAREVELPFGTLQIESDPKGYYYAGSPLKDFASLSDFAVRGLRNRYRQTGIGAALVATPVLSGDGRVDRWQPRQGKVPVTAVLRFEDPMRGMASGTLHAVVEIHDALNDPTTTVAGTVLPLETDYTAALAYRLENSPLWDFEFAGFRSGDFSGLFYKKDPDLAGSGLFMLHPYSPGRIPIVFVHGTASSPARWAQMVNEIMGDPKLARKYQCWFFLYTTGNPIPYSALRLREALEAVVKDIDPEGRDEALRKMVVIGHSQGGLLTKMQVVNSGDEFWHNISSQPFDEAPLSPETRDLLRRGLFVKPVPYVKRVIFIATPHRGSFLADNIFGKLGRKLINLPGNLVHMGSEFQNLQGPVAQLPTSIDNMKSDNRFLKTLVAMPIAPGVFANSIIAVKGDGPVAQGDDGVVKYQSAHIAPVQSEFVVRSSHSTQATPATIEEVRRILYLHLDES